jgi:hypothetical protein
MIRRKFLSAHMRTCGRGTGSRRKRKVQQPPHPDDTTTPNIWTGGESGEVRACGVRHTSGVGFEKHKSSCGESVQIEL